MPTGKPTKLKKCSICGELFLPAKPSSRICPKNHIANCPVCGKEIVWNTTSKVEPCCKECRKEATRQMYNEKYGCDHPMQNKAVQAHHKQAMIDKYGVDSPLKSESIRSKAIQTNREKFGADWALGSSAVHSKIKETMTERYGAGTTLQSQTLKAKVQSTMKERYGSSNPANVSDFREAIKQTNINKYGVENPMQNSEIAAKSAQSRSQSIDSILEKCKQTWMQNRGVDNPSKDIAVIDKITETFMERYGVKRAVNVPEFREKMINSMVAKYGVPYYCMTDEFKNSNHFRISSINTAFSTKLTEYGIEHQLEFPLGKKSFDFILPQSKTLIEVDPSYTHNIIGNHWNKDGIDSNYHKDKTALAEQYGYRCIHVFDWDNWDKIIQSLLPRKSIYARNLSIYKLNSDVANEFLSNYHFQGTCKGQLLCLGLVKDNILYQVMTFGKSRYDTKHDIELLRLCSLPGYNVIGGASKLFKFATQGYGLSNIISYCDKSKFSGSVYEKIGMKLIRTTPPQEIWSKQDKKITANLLRQRGYDQLFNTNYGKGTSNDFLMIENGWLPVYDCGQSVYEFV